MSLPPLVTSPSHWLLGPAYHVRRDPLTHLPRWFREHGDLFMVRSPLGCAVIVGAPPLAQQVLPSSPTLSASAGNVRRRMMIC
jgi:hypothetical protein